MSTNAQVLMFGLFWWFLKIQDTAVSNNEIWVSGRLQPAWHDIADQFCQDPETWQSSDYHYMICQAWPEQASQLKHSPWSSSITIF